MGDWQLPITINTDNQICKLGKVNMVRRHTVHFTISDSIVIDEYADEWEHQNHDGRKMALMHIDRKLKRKGVEAFDIALNVKIKEIDEDE
jgi:hypothetical protein|tara:strand:- start:1639 stop:1908 length:270 start_codon:yes stop_codon:yes gene_type:complete